MQTVKPIPAVALKAIDGLYVIAPSGCWIWQKGLTPKGYGRVCAAGIYFLAHRVSYVRFVGTLKPQERLDHLCFNRACINPDHLEKVTNAVNVQRGRAARLSPNNVNHIRSLSASGYTRKQISARYGISESYVSAICLKRRWGNV